MPRSYSLLVGGYVPPLARSVTDVLGLTDTVILGSGVTPVAPLAAYTQGTQAGVPAGLSLTATSGLPTPDATVPFTRTDPVDGTAVSLTGVKRWSARSWSTTLSGSVPSGEVWWFDRCRFAMAASAFFCFDVNTPNGPNTRKSPTLIFTQCEFDGGGHTDKALTANRAWVERCVVNVDQGGDIGGCEDGWIGCAYCTVIESNIRCGVGLNTTDPHSDGIQMTDTGGTALYRCWLSGGGMTGPLTGNSAFRVGTEFGAVTGVDVLYCGFGGRGAQTVQFRGDNGPTGSPITGVRFRGCRWCDSGSAFLWDFQQEPGGGTMLAEWSDIARGTDGVVGGVSYTAGQVLASPGV